MKNHGNFNTLSEIESWLTSHNVSGGIGVISDIKIGDYFTISNKYTVWIGGIDTELNKGNNPLGSHHVSCVCNFGASKMNSSNTTSGGYNGATIMQSFLTSKANELSAITGSHLLTRRVLLSNGINNGKSNSWAWYDKQLTLLTEPQFYGSTVVSNVYDIGEGFCRLPIFNLLPSHYMFGQANIWLRAVSTGTSFAMSSGNGNAGDAASSFEGASALALFCLG